MSDVSIREAKLDALITQANDQRERMLQGAITTALGTGDWTPESLQGRVGYSLGSRATTYWLDGRPILRETMRDVVHQLYPMQHPVIETLADYEFLA